MKTTTAQSLYGTVVLCIFSLLLLNSCAKETGYLNQDIACEDHSDAEAKAGHFIAQHQVGNQTWDDDGLECHSPGTNCTVSSLPVRDDRNLLVFLELHGKNPQFVADFFSSSEWLQVFPELNDATNTATLNALRKGSFSCEKRASADCEFFLFKDTDSEVVFVKGFDQL